MVSVDDDIVSFLRETQKQGHNQLLNITLMSNISESHCFFFFFFL